MIEIGIGLLIIAIFSAFSVGIFNGCYNNYHAIQRRNLALKYGIQTMERALQNDLDSLGFTASMQDRDDILAAVTNDNKADGSYAVPADREEEVDEYIKVTTSFRRIPTESTTKAYDNTVLKVTVLVEYKIKANDSNWRQLKLESVKVTT